MLRRSECRVEGGGGGRGGWSRACRGAGGASTSVSVLLDVTGHVSFVINRTRNTINKMRIVTLLIMRNDIVFR